MAGPTFSSLTREGFAYVVVSLFVAAAALLRNINLLILLNGLMIAPLLLSWRICGSSLRRLVLRRVTRTFWYAGRPDAIHWEAYNPHWILPAWQLLIEDRLVADIGQSADQPEPARTRMVLEQVGAGRHQSVSWRVLFPRRGLYTAGPARVNTSFPFGLIRASRKIESTTTIVVAPAPGKLVAGWDRRLVSQAIGDSAVKRRAGLQGDEFFAVRPWRNGDSLRLIHWRSTARQGRPMVRQHDRRSDRDLILVLDLWRPATTSGSALETGSLPGEEKGSDPKLLRRLRVLASDPAGPDDPCEVALSFAMSAVLLAERETRGQIIVAVCGDSSRVIVARPEGNSTGLGEIHSALATASASGAPDVGTALREIANLTPAGSPVYLISTRPVPGTILFELDDQMAPTLAQLQPWLRFLSPGTPGFDAIFTPSRPADSSPEPSGPLMKSRAAAMQPASSAAGDSREAVR